jgi:hypothetical protein
MPESELLLLIKQVARDAWNKLIAEMPEVQEEMNLADFEDELRLMVTA